MKKDLKIYLVALSCYLAFILMLFAAAFGEDIFPIIDQIPVEYVLIGVFCVISIILIYKRLTAQKLKS